VKKNTNKNLLFELVESKNHTVLSKHFGMRLHIRADIKLEIKNKKCVILRTSNPLINPKNGRKDDLRVINVKTQVLDDFQAFSKAANNSKRQSCKVCKATDIRYDAKTLGYPVSFTQGTSKYEKPMGCVGCYWYDPIEFMKNFR
jgi:hypothetical protein